MMALTLVEKECQNVLSELQFYLTSTKKVNLGTYAKIVNSVARTLDRLKNKEYGCASGLHRGQCLCTLEKEGMTIEGMLYKKRMAQKGKQ